MRCIFFDLTQILGMDMVPAKVFAAQWETTRPSLLRQAHQVMLTGTKLENLTWKLGITAATNHVSQVHRTNMDSFLGLSIAGLHLRPVELSHEHGGICAEKRDYRAVD